MASKEKFFEVLDEHRAFINAAMCPLCDGGMKLRFAKADDAPFLGCADYPQCRGTKPLPTAGQRDPRTRHKGSASYAGADDDDGLPF
jgi:ssDNA-binding Zn-finger/Zn-ribbon topoisomerase 1